MTKLLKRPEVGAIASLLVIWTIFAILAPRFLSQANMGNILTAAAEMGIIAIGMALLIITGEFDISVGSVFVLAPIVMLKLATVCGVPLLVAFVVAMVLAGCVGLFNGFLTIRFGFPSFIVTMASMLLIGGIILAVTGGFVTSYSTRNLLFDVLTKRIGSFRVSTVWLFAIGGTMAFILDNTRYGNSVYATGGSPVVARKLGINVRRVKMTNFVLCSMLAGFAGCIGTARVFSVNPTASFDLMFNAAAAAFIGGCLITGGRGSIIGTVVGAILLSSLSSGLIFAGASPYWYRAFVGGIILLAVGVNFAVTKGVRRAT
jgi:simple sugar transport system permease protein